MIIIIIININIITTTTTTWYVQSTTMIRNRECEKVGYAKEW